MSSEIRILHLASFTGNVGDNANHKGFRPWFERQLGRPTSWHELEIREFYWKQRAFDADFGDLANSFDLLVIGGGNYFELWVSDSHTGTSLNIPAEVFSKIKVPIFFNALGVDAGQGAPAPSVDRFGRFLEILGRSQQYLVTVRNDGARRTLTSLFSDSLANSIPVLPDGGFFAEFDTQTPSYFDHGVSTIGINLACDMEQVRFGDTEGADGYAGFHREISEVIATVTSDRVAVVFFPHIFSDLRVITDVIDGLPDAVRRTKVAVAPYRVGPAAADCTFGGYRACDLVVGMRFHANVCPIGLGRPTIGLASYPQITYLYQELDFPQGCVDVTKAGFAQELSSRISDAVRSPEDLTNEMREIARRVRVQRDSLAPVVAEWMNANSLSAP